MFTKLYSVLSGTSRHCSVQGASDVSGHDQNFTNLNIKTGDKEILEGRVNSKTVFTHSAHP